MKRIFFIHGLESSNKSPKVDLMIAKGYHVLAPSMDYTTNDLLFSQTLEKVLAFQPHVIVGSSMGGHFAQHIGEDDNWEFIGEDEAGEPVSMPYVRDPHADCC